MENAADLPCVRTSAQIIASRARNVFIRTEGVASAAEKLMLAMAAGDLSQPAALSSPSLSIPSPSLEYSALPSPSPTSPSPSLEPVGSPSPTPSPSPSLEPEDPPSSSPSLEPAGLEEGEVLKWLFLLDTLNYCFWSDGDTLFTVSYQGQQWTGYRSLVAALARAVENGIPVYEPSYYGEVTLSELESLFQSETHIPIPLLEQRLACLHEAATVLQEEFGGDVGELLSRSKKSAVGLSRLLASHFPSFRDVGTYGGQPVAFLKRAQIFPASVWNRFQGKGFGEFHDIDALTMFADYRVPQALLQFTVLSYSDELMQKLLKGEHLMAGSEEEMEIRGCSIWAVELIKNKINELSSSSSFSSSPLITTIPTTPSYQRSPINSVRIDFFLWSYAKAHSELMSHLPIHRTRTIFY